MNNNFLRVVKYDPVEDIENGDIIMFNEYKATRAVIEKDKRNDTLVVGVCTNSNKDKQVIVNGGSSDPNNIVLFDGGSSNNETPKEVYTGNSKEEHEIEIALSGKQVVNMYNYSNIYDEVTISEVPGRGQSKDYDLRALRSIGRITQFLDNGSQVKVDLNIE